ncbi:translation repressor RelB [Paraeggerthella hongkongensis]|uniref:Translation repressor RelB n=1 Tax=Paraeggerthella hongkongensis TaxID=230658 RepID=A0A3N0BKL9_9ACTN|nr:translation repressor RelB [Paraeggerthella hongkongensis]RNL48979.1 translation repressor RelB [Paraeggerthella hongkongensis]
MAGTQMNLRIEAQIKERGDAALAEAGYTPSQAVRVIWAFAAEHANDPHAIKGLLRQAEAERGLECDERIEAKRRALECGLGLHDRLAAALGPLPPCDQCDPPDRELRGEALFGRWEQRGLA